MQLPVSDGPGREPVTGVLDRQGVADQHHNAQHPRRWTALTDTITGYASAGGPAGSRQPPTRPRNNRQDGHPVNIIKSSS